MISIPEDRYNLSNSKKQLNPQAIEFVPKVCQTGNQETNLNPVEQDLHLHKFLSHYDVTLNIICLFPHDLKKHFLSIVSAFKACINYNVLFTKPTIEYMVRMNIDQAIKNKNYSKFSSKFCYHLDVMLYEHPSSTRTNLLAEEMSIVYMYKKFINLITEFYFEDLLATQEFQNFCSVISDYFVTARNRNQQPYPFLGQALVRLLYELLNSNDSKENLQIVYQFIEYSFKTLIVAEDYNKEHLSKMKTIVESRLTLEEKENEKYKLLSKVRDMVITIEFNHSMMHTNIDPGLLSTDTQEITENENDQPVCREEEWDEFLDQFGDPVCDPPELSSLEGVSTAD
ncbi:hypothetical protein LOD99_4462 [Oopsacas minuta]|uniref:Uncharacterized protein n=1 Tax=Oopsacas minuta TaxID=111878 RepID=A0AAV7JUR0_9METZ|nr:hypothetical protein LOD99_4462 [Oopsacas minuta]